MKQVSVDFQGWPICMYTLEEILIKFLDGSIEYKACKRIRINLGVSTLEIIPTVLEDDGMGMGVNPKHITKAIGNNDNIDLLLGDYEGPGMNLKDIFLAIGGIEDEDGSITFYEGLDIYPRTLDLKNKHCPEQKIIDFGVDGINKICNIFIDTEPIGIEKDETD